MAETQETIKEITFNCQAGVLGAKALLEIAGKDVTLVCTHCYDGTSTEGGGVFTGKIDPDSNSKLVILEGACETEGLKQSDRQAMTVHISPDLD